MLLRRTIQRLSEEQKATSVVIDLSHVTVLDTTAEKSIYKLQTELVEKGHKIEILEIPASSTDTVTPTTGVTGVDNPAEAQEEESDYSEDSPKKISAPSDKTIP